MSYELLIKELKKKKNLDIIIYLKNKFRYQGKLMDTGSKSLKIEERKAGEVIVMFDEIGSIFLNKKK